jgi:hypothetical protein
VPDPYPDSQAGQDRNGQAANEWKKKDGKTGGEPGGHAGRDRGRWALYGVDEPKSLADELPSLEVPETAKPECQYEFKAHLSALLTSQYETYHF